MELKVGESEVSREVWAPWYRLILNGIERYIKLDNDKDKGDRPLILNGIERNRK